MYKLKTNDKAPEFKLKATDDKTYSLDDFKKPLVVFFTCNHCPYTRAYDDRVNELVDKYPQISFVGINSNDSDNYPEDGFEEMKKRKDTKFVYLRDDTQEVARSFGGVCTPHFFLFDKDLKLKYQGRLDDDWKAENISKKELEDAIKSLLEGKNPKIQTTNTIGCSIKWKP